MEKITKILTTKVYLQDKEEVMLILIKVMSIHFININLQFQIYHRLKDKDK